MKQNITTFKTSLLLAGSLALAASCQDYEPFSEQQVQDRAYTQAFENQFGEIDPNQDWDLFGQLARHIGPVTRAGEGELPTKTPLPEKMEVSLEQHDTYTKVLPELNISDNSYEYSNLGQVTQDFTSTARKFTLAPVHWTTSSTDAIGIYWYVDDEDESDTQMMGKDGHMYFLKHYTIFDNHKTGLQIVYEKEDGTKVTTTGDMGDVSSWILSPEQMAEEKVIKQYLLSQPVEVSVPNNIMSYGFWIRTNSDSGSGTRYSEWNLNPKPKFNDRTDGNTKIESDDKHRMSYATTFNLKGLNIPGENDNTQYLCFEDWFDWSDADLNDVVYHAEGLDETTIVDKSSITENAILVCEDLAKFDFDFNDVALGLTYKEETGRSWSLVPEETINGKTIAEHWEATPTGTISQKLTVLAMAAGGAYESTIYVGGSEEENPWDEIHMLLHENPYKNGTNHAIINAGATYAALGDFFTIDMSNYEWNVGNGDGQYATHLSQLFLQDYIRIACTDGSAQKVIGNRKYSDDKSTNTVPQMMLFPWYFEWPQEMINIKLAYTGFADWVADYTKTNWIYDTQVADKVTDRGEFKPEEEEEEGGSTVYTETFELPVTQPGTFTYTYTDTDGNTQTATYNRGYFIDLSTVSHIVGDDAKAEITVHYTYKPNTSVYVDDANGNLIVWDNFGENAATTTQYTISAKKFNKAVESGGIWIVALNDAQMSISGVELKIIGVTDSDKRHDLTVPSTLTFTSLGSTQSIGAVSTTGATLTYSSNDTSVATVDANGDVKAVAEGTTVITVTAAASGEYLENVKQIHVTVTDGVVITLALGEPTSTSNYIWGYPLESCIASTTEDLSSYSSVKLTINVSYGPTSTESWCAFNVKTPTGQAIYSEQQIIGTSTSLQLTPEQISWCKDGDLYKLNIEYTTLRESSLSSVTMTLK